MTSALSKSCLVTTMVVSIGLVGCQSIATNTIATHTARLVSTQNQQAMGKIDFKNVAGGVLVSGTVTGLAPNSVHGIHIHQNGDCGDMGKGAGGHFNPFNKMHGHPSSEDSHAGGLPNITANADGVATLNFINPKISLVKGADNSVLNRSVILHDKADDYQSQPAGNSGDRIACAVIQ